jgi:hypothetical protein
MSGQRPPVYNNKVTKEQRGILATDGTDFTDCWKAGLDLTANGRESTRIVGRLLPVGRPVRRANGLRAGREGFCGDEAVKHLA